MTEDELKKLDGVRKEPTRIGLQPGPDRTLAYGYDVERNTFHVYQKDGEIHRLLYLGSAGHSVLLDHESGPDIEAAMCVPNKRLYPEACDYGFMAALTKAGVHLPFTTYNPDRRAQAFHGKVAEDIAPPALAP